MRAKAEWAEEVRVERVRAIHALDKLAYQTYNYCTQQGALNCGEQTAMDCTQQAFLNLAYHANDSQQLHTVRSSQSHQANSPRLHPANSHQHRSQQLTSEIDPIDQSMQNYQRSISALM